MTTAPATSIVNRVLMGGEEAAVRAHARQVIGQFPNVSAVTTSATEALRLATVSIGSIAVADVATTLKTALDPNADNGADQLKTIIGRLVEAR